MIWESYSLRYPDGILAWEATGAGHAVLWLGGGPGDDPQYLKAVASRFAGFRHILLHQRGTELSQLDTLNERTADPIEYINDIDRVLDLLRLPNPTIVGHSWGANLALLYASLRPTRLRQAICLGLGPLDHEMAAIAGDKLLHKLTEDQRSQYHLLRVEEKQAIAANDEESYLRARGERLRLMLPGWFVDSNLASEFIREYVNSGVYRKMNKRLHELTFESYMKIDHWALLPNIARPVSIIYGSHDFEPLEQAARISQTTNKSTTHIMPHCGHVVWMEQATEFADLLTQLLSPEQASI